MPGIKITNKVTDIVSKQYMKCIALDCSFNSSQNLRSVTQTLPSPSACEGGSMVKSHSQKVKQQRNELQHLVHSKVNMQITNSSSPSQERLGNIALQNEVKKLKENFEYERSSNARTSNKVRTLENEWDSCLVTAIQLLKMMTKLGQHLQTPRHLSSINRYLFIVMITRIG